MADADSKEKGQQQDTATKTQVMAEPEKSPAETSHEEWQNPINWGGPGNMAVYFSKRDRRIWVPKPKPGIGWTVNLAHTGGILWLVGLCMGMIILLAFIVSWAFADQIVRMLK